MATLKPMMTKKFMGEACNCELQVELAKMCKRVRRAHSGVWASALLKSIEHLVDELPTLTEHEIDPVLVASWQPTLYEVVDGGDGLKLCPRCKDREMPGTARVCWACAQQEAIDGT